MDPLHGYRDFPLQISWIFPIFAVNKRRKEMDMTTIMILLGVFMVGVGIGLMDKGKQKMKKKNKSRKRSVFDDDPFFGTPLQKLD